MEILLFTIQFQCSIFLLIFVFLNIFWSALASFHWENETHTTVLRALFSFSLELVKAEEKNRALCFLLSVFWVLLRKRERDRERDMLCSGRLLAVSFPVNRYFPYNLQSSSSRFSYASPKSISRCRSMTSEPESSSFAPSIDSDPTDTNPAGYSLSLSSCLAVKNRWENNNRNRKL